MAFFCFRFFFVVTNWTFYFRPRAHFQHGGRQGVIYDFLISLLSKLYLGEITVVCGKYEQSGHCDDLLYTIQLQVQQHGCRMPPRSYLRFAYLISKALLRTNCCCFP